MSAIRITFWQPLRWRSGAVILLGFLSFAGFSSGATLTWDSSGTSPASPADGGGNWNTSTVCWSNGTTNAAWSNTSNATAAFGNNRLAAGTVTAGNVTAAGMIFNPAGSGFYVIAGGNITLSGTAPGITTNANATVSAALVAGGLLTKSGNGTLTLSGNNTFTGSLVLNAGTLILGGFQQNAIGGAGISLQGGALVLNGFTGSNGTDWGTFSGGVDVPASRTGTIRLMQRGTFASNVTGVSTSTLNVQVAFIRGAIAGDWSGFRGRINVSGAAGSEFRISSGNGFGNATIDLGGGVTMAQVFNPPDDGLAGGTTQAIGMLTGSGILGGQPVAGRVVNWQVGGSNASGTFAGVVQDGVGAARITKVGAGTWTLANPCTYSGPTVVREGTLIVNGLSNSSGVSVAAGAILGGNGTISGPVTMEFNSTLQAGHTLTFAGGVNLAQPDGSRLTVRFGATGGGFGVLNPIQLAGGNITTSGNVTLEADVQSGVLVPGTYVLATGAAAGSGTANVYFSGGPKGLVARLDATSQPGKLLLVVYPVAFPGAEGYGAIATGGRGGAVYHVTNLNDSGAGSFRDAVSQPNRTVVFDVGGIINLASDVEVVDNITIAGQTAPGQGISTYGATVYLNHQFGVPTAYSHSNIIIRHMRFRQGYVATPGGYSLALKPAHKVIIDHCSIEIGNWQTLSISLNTSTGEQPSNITVQNCIVGASISTQLGVLNWDPVNLTFHHNLFIDNGGRDPKVEGNMQVINDVVYNYQLGVYGNGVERCDFIGNYHIAGPDSNALTTNAGLRATAGDYYISGNYWDKTRDGTLAGSPLTSNSTTDFKPVFAGAPLNSPQVPVTVDSAQLAYYKVVSRAGASLSRDPLDEELISHVTSLGTRGPGGQMGTSYVPGLYLKHDTAADPVTGNPLPAWTITGGTAPTDTDRDGMPDDWERAKGWNPAVADSNTVLGDGYTRLEHYLNWMAEPHLRLVNNAAATIDLAPLCDAFPAATSTFSVSGVVNGSAVLMADGHSVRFSPGGSFAGLASFDFTAKAQDGTTLTRTVGVLGAPAKNLVWKGDGSANVWNNATSNWLNQAAPATFGNADSVTFNDSGSAVPAVNLAGFQTPGNVTFSNSSSKNYTLGGNGSINGDTRLVKTGNGTLTLWPNVTLSSNTTLNSKSVTVPTAVLSSGMLVTGAGIPAATTVAAVVDATHLTLSQNATATASANLTYSGGNNTYSGGTSLQGGGVVLGGVQANQAALGTGPVTFAGGALTLFNNGNANSAGTFSNDLVVVSTGTLNTAPRCVIGGNASGNGTLNYYTPYNRADLTGNWAAFTGRINVTTDADGGDFRVANTAGYPAAALSLGAKAVLNFGGTVPAGGLTLDVGELASSAADSKLQGAATAANILTWRIGGRNTDSLFAGSISEQNASSVTALVKAGAGTLRLGGSCTHLGNTTVSGGALIVNGNMTLSRISVASGSRLSGNGTLPLTQLAGGATLAPGDGVGTLRLTGNLTLGAASALEWEISGNALAPADKVTAGNLTVGSGCAVNLVLNRNGSTVRFADTFWSAARSWPVVSATRQTGNFTIGSVSADSGGISAAGFGAFGLAQTALGTTLNWTPFPPAQRWRYAWFGTTANSGLAADTADPDNDGEANLLEFATGQSPAAGTKAAASLSIAAPNLEFTYTRSVASVADGVTFAVQWSDSLASNSWSATGVTQSVQSDNGTLQTVKASLPAGTSGKRFVRLVVTKP